MTGWTARSLAAGLALLALWQHPVVSLEAQTAGPSAQVPQFQFDPTWPKQPFPNYEVIGNVIGLAIDARQHIWVLHRPQMVSEQEQGAAFGYKDALCCRPAKPVLEIDQSGSVIQTWGGGSPWVVQEHGIFVDHKDNVWIGSPQDSQLLKFSRTGAFLMRIGEPGHKEPTSDNPKILGGPAPWVDAAANEVFVADGYRNRRIIVFDADTGAFKRMWGAYGKTPDDSVKWTFNPAGTDVAPSQQFQTVTGVVISHDGLVYVSDRTNNRIQVFTKDGTFKREGFVAPKTPRGTIDTLAFSADPEQRFIYDADPRNMRVWILRRSDLQVLGWFGYGGHQAGGFVSPAYIVVDASGNLYVGEGQDGKRVQRFLYKGLGQVK
jgi:DNA-binding beta-propeller fold protein YncE